MLSLAPNSAIFRAVHNICYTCTIGVCIMAIHISKLCFWYSDFWPKSKHQCWKLVLRKVFIFPFQNPVSLKWFYHELSEDIQSNMSNVKEKGLFFISSYICRNDTNTQSMYSILVTNSRFVLYIVLTALYSSNSETQLLFDNNWVCVINKSDFGNLTLPLL